MTAASHTLQTDQECKDVTGFSADELYSSSVISAVTCESNSYRCNGSCNAPVSSTSLKMSLIYGVLLSNDAASLWTRWGTLQHTLSTGEQIVLWHKNSCTRDSGIPNVFEMLLNQKRTCNIALATLQREIIQQRGKGMIGSNGKHIKIWSRRDCGRSRGMKEIEKHLTVVMRDKKKSRFPFPFQQMKEEIAVKIK